MKKVFTLFALFFTYNFVHSNELTDTIGVANVIPNTTFSKGIFDYADWSRPFWADMHSSITRGEMAWAVNSEEYNYGDNEGTYRPYIFSNLGVDLPIWAGRFKNGKFGFGATLPFYIDVWMDFFERSTAPVVNTSYRFGAPEFVFIHKLDKKFMNIRNYSVKLTPFKHECTHLGDELTIYRKNKEMEITRVNVSYNYFEVGITINDPENSTKSNHAFHFAIMRLISPELGWYNIQDNEGDVSLVVPAKNPYEFYVQYQYQSNTTKSHLQFIFSGEIRNRPRYNYPFYYSLENDPYLEYYPDDENWRGKSSWTLNGLLGVRYNNPKVLKDYKVGLGVRGYLGINPYGQFRSMPIYNQLGFCLLFER